MGAMSVACAVLALVALAIPGPGKYVAVGLGLFAMACGVVGWRRVGRTAASRLAGASGVALGVVAFLLGGAEVVLTILALDRFSHIF
jgi:hypothetical protein